MDRSVAQISEEIQALSASDQEALLRALLEQIDGLPDPSADAAWLAEAQRRSREIDEGMVRCIPADEVFARLSSQLK